MKVLITAGQVYGRLDDNKLVGNRVRGIWAMKYAAHLAGLGHDVTLLVPDTITRVIIQEHIPPREGRPGTITVTKQTGFVSYREKCVEMAATHDAAIMAAAVVNWIPRFPIGGKMRTEGYKVGDIINVPFMLAPRVIEEMKAVNPKLTLIGCKMLIGATSDKLIEAAYGVLLRSRCNAVLANDMEHGLKHKLIINQDRSVQEFNNDFLGLFETLTAIVEDEHYRTEWTQTDHPVAGNVEMFDRVVQTYRHRFTQRQDGSDRVFGSVFLATGITTLGIVSPREKGKAFTAKDAVVITRIDNTVVHAEGPNKPTLNAPLLCRFAWKFGHRAVVHFHDRVPTLPMLPYAPPGTVRDNQRELPDNCKDGFNIEGHGCVVPVNTERWE
jgi:hypothetical protein